MPTSFTIVSFCKLDKYSFLFFFLKIMAEGEGDTLLNMARYDKSVRSAFVLLIFSTWPSSQYRNAKITRQFR